MLKDKNYRKNNEFHFISKITLPLKVQSCLRKVRMKRKGAMMPGLTGLGWK